MKTILLNKQKHIQLVAGLWAIKCGFNFRVNIYNLIFSEALTFVEFLVSVHLMNFSKGKYNRVILKGLLSIISPLIIINNSL